MIDFKDVETLIASNVATIRKELYAALKHIGVGKIVEVSTIAEVEIQMRQEFDVLILADELEDTFTGPLVQGIRSGRQGNHPFPIILFLVPSADPDRVSRIADCGADGAMLTATAGAQIGARFTALAAERKPFVVTYNYIGPDRRREKRVEEVVCPTLETPNPVAVKTRRGGALQLPRDIKIATEKLNTMKIDNISLQLRWLIDGIMKAMKSDPVGTDIVVANARHLIEAAEDIQFRTKRWLTSPIAELATTLAAIARDIETGGAAIDQTQLMKLMRAGHAVAQEIKRMMALMGT